MVYREIALARLTAARVHILQSRRPQRRTGPARQERGIRVHRRGLSATTSHLTTSTRRTYDSNFQDVAPFADEQDVEAILDAPGAYGTLDGSGHRSRPHAPEKKDCASWTRRPTGSSAWRHSCPVHQGLIEPGVLDLAQMLEKMTINPARVLGMTAARCGRAWPPERDGHRSQRRVDDRPQSVSARESQLSLRRLKVRGRAGRARCRCHQVER